MLINAYLHAQHMGQHGKFLCHISIDHHKVGSHPDFTLFAMISLASWSVFTTTEVPQNCLGRSRAWPDAIKNPEGAVRLASYPEDGHLVTRPASKVHDRTDLAVWMYSHPCPRIGSCQGAGSHSAVPEGDGPLRLVHGHRISEKGCLISHLRSQYTMDSAPYTSDSQLAAIPSALSMASTEHTGVPKEVKKSGQHLDDKAPMWLSAT